VGGETARLMVGRDRELARVTGLLDDARAGQGRLVLCVGEAGIGKTRLAEEAAAAAAARGTPAVWARAADRGSSPPYGLWRLVLDHPAIRGDTGGDSRPDLWSQVFGDTERAALAESADSGSASRFALFAEVRRRLAEAAEPAGLLLVFDDLQWADEASAVLLADLVRQLRGTRVLVLASYRAAPGPGDETLLRLSAEANAERVDLRGLPADAIGDLLRATGLPASAEQVDEVRSETGGNPFLVRELARMLADQRGGEPGAVPGRVADATAYRLAQVSQPARALLQTAAVAGNSFSAGVVAGMLGAPVLSLLGPLDECRTAGFVVAGDRPGDYRFSHALVRSAVAARLSAAEQRRLHTAAADAIEALYEGQVRLHLADVARHRVEASLPGDRADRARAVAACEAAAGAAAEAVAFEEAVRLYRQALSAGGEEIGEPDRDRLELALATVLHRSGDLPGAQQTATRVGRRAERRRDRLGLARTVLAMEATGVPEWDGEICRICEQALAGDDLSDDLRARVSARYAQALVYRGEYDRAGPVSQAALAAAESAGDPVALVDALRARQLACCAPEGLAERIVLATIFPALTLALIRLGPGDRSGAEAAYTLAGPIRSWTPSPAMRMSAWGHALAVAIGLGRTEDIEFLAGRFEPFRGQHAANGAGAGVYMGPVELQLGLAAAALGRLDAAAADLQTAASICDANGARGYAVQARVELAAALARRQAPGGLSLAQTVLDAAAGEAEQLGMVPFTRRIEQLQARLPAAAAARSSLSPRELEVARLVARGLTNKQIGETLFVSERTAENHVQHILVKLGFSNRSQIAAWSSAGPATDARPGRG
jgi:DNA-binding CsgD family transcriptional regulator